MYAVTNVMALRTGELLASKHLIKPSSIELVLTEAKRRSTLPPQRFGDAALAAGCLNESAVQLAQEVLETDLHPRLILQGHQLQDVYKSILRREALLVVGAGFSLNHATKSPGLTSANLIKALTPKMHELCSNQDAQRAIQLGLPAMAQIFVNNNRQEHLLRTVEDCCREHLPLSPLEHHHILATLDCFPFIITTNWDRLLETSFQSKHGFQNQPSLNIIRNDAELRRLKVHRTTLFKLNGDFDGQVFEAGYKPVIAEAEFVQAREENPNVYTLIETLCVGYDVVLVGYRIDDYNLKLIETSVSRRFQRHGTVYIVDPFDTVNTSALPFPTTRIDLDAGNFFRYLADFANSQGGRLGLSSEPPGSSMGDSADTTVFRLWAPEQTQLAKKLRNRFRLDHVEVIRPDSSSGSSSAKVAIGKRAANLLPEWLKPGDSVCLGGGDTLKRMVEALNPDAANIDNLTVFAGSLRAFPALSALGSTTLLSLLVERLRHRNCSGLIFPVQSYLAERWMLAALPAGKNDASDHTVIHADEILAQVKQYFSDAGMSRVTIVGVGSLDMVAGGFAELSRTCISSNGVDPNHVDGFLGSYKHQLRDLGFVGDILCRPIRNCPGFDIDEGPEEQFIAEDVVKAVYSNESLDLGWREYIAKLYYSCWSLTPTDLHSAAASSDRQVLLLATGANKAHATRALCKNRLVSSLIIDEHLGEALLAADYESI